MTSTLLTNCRIVNEGSVRAGDVRIKDGRIDAIAGNLSAREGESVCDCGGNLLFPGLIDDQVHFREPGLTHKADIFSESRAAAAGGVTSYMEMPNVLPPTLTMELLEEKRRIAAQHSLTNYAFYLGAGNDNLEEVARADARRIAGIKVFMGASTGNLLVDAPQVLARIFACAPTLIATHCEHTPRIKARQAEAAQQYGEDIPAAAHATIRDATACYDSSSLAVNLAREHGARLHVLHLTTAKELPLFAEKDGCITCEACAHHLLFDDSDYARLGMRLKCNPAVKTRADRTALRRALAGGVIDVLATDHAPHLPQEKDQPYTAAAAGLPLVEYALPAFLELVADGDLSYADVALRAAHRVAEIFAVSQRGFIREGYWADLALVEEVKAWADGGVREAVLSKCGWTPFHGMALRHRVVRTFVNGSCVWDNGAIADNSRGMALEFTRTS